MREIYAPAVLPAAVHICGECESVARLARRPASQNALPPPPPPSMGQMAEAAPSPPPSSCRQARHDGRRPQPARRPPHAQQVGSRAAADARGRLVHCRRRGRHVCRSRGLLHLCPHALLLQLPPLHAGRAGRPPLRLQRRRRHLHRLLVRRRLLQRRPAVHSCRGAFGVLQCSPLFWLRPAALPALHANGYAAPQQPTPLPAALLSPPTRRPCGSCSPPPCRKPR